MQFEKTVVNLMKKIGTVPKNNPIVVRPKAKPGDFFKTETSKAKVIDIVMLNNKIPNKEMYIKLSPKIKNGNDATILMIAIFLIPKASDKIPPRAFPTPIVQYSKIV